MAHKMSGDMSRLMTTSQISHASSLGILTDMELDDTNLLTTVSPGKKPNNEGSEKLDSNSAISNKTEHAVSQPKKYLSTKEPASNINTQKTSRILNTTTSKIARHSCKSTIPSLRQLDKTITKSNSVKCHLNETRPVAEPLGGLAPAQKGREAMMDEDFDEGEVDREISGVVTPEIDEPCQTSESGNDENTSPEPDTAHSVTLDLTFDIDQGKTSTPNTPLHPGTNPNNSVRPKLQSALVRVRGGSTSSVKMSKTDSNTATNKEQQRSICNPEELISMDDEEYPKRMRTSDEFAEGPDKSLNEGCKGLSASFELAKTAVTQYASLLQGAEKERAQSLERRRSNARNNNATYPFSQQVEGRSSSLDLGEFVINRATLKRHASLSPNKRHSFHEDCPVRRKQTSSFTAIHRLHASYDSASLRQALSNVATQRLQKGVSTQNNPLATQQQLLCAAHPDEQKAPQQCPQLLTLDRSSQHLSQEADIDCVHATSTPVCHKNTVTSLHQYATTKNTTTSQSGPCQGDTHAGINPDQSGIIGGICEDTFSNSEKQVMAVDRKNQENELRSRTERITSDNISDRGEFNKSSCAQKDTLNLKSKPRESTGVTHSAIVLDSGLATLNAQLLNNDTIVFANEREFCGLNNDSVTLKHTSLNAEDSLTCINVEDKRGNGNITNCELANVCNTIAGQISNGLPPYVQGKHGPSVLTDYSCDQLSHNTRDNTQNIIGSSRPVSFVSMTSSTDGGLGRDLNCDPGSPEILHISAGDQHHDCGYEVLDIPAGAEFTNLRVSRDRPISMMSATSADTGIESVDGEGCEQANILSPDDVRLLRKGYNWENNDKESTNDVPHKCEGVIADAQIIEANTIQNYDVIAASEPGATNQSCENPTETMYVHKNARDRDEIGQNPNQTSGLLVMASVTESEDGETFHTEQEPDYTTDKENLAYNAEEGEKTRCLDDQNTEEIPCAFPDKMDTVNPESDYRDNVDYLQIHLDAHTVNENADMTSKSTPDIEEEANEEVDGLIVRDTGCALSCSAILSDLSNRKAQYFMLVSAAPPPDIEQDQFNVDEREDEEDLGGEEVQDIEMLDTSDHSKKSDPDIADSVTVPSVVSETEVPTLLPMIDITLENSTHSMDVESTLSLPIANEDPVDSNHNLHTDMTDTVAIEFEGTESVIESDQIVEANEDKIKEKEEKNETADSHAKLTPSKKGLKGTSGMKEALDTSTKIKRPSLLARASSLKTSTKPKPPQTNRSDTSSQLKRPVNPLVGKASASPAFTAKQNADSSKITKRKTDPSSNPVPSKKAASSSCALSGKKSKAPTNKSTDLNASVSSSLDSTGNAVSKIGSGSKTTSGQSTGVVKSRLLPPGTRKLATTPNSGATEGKGTTQAGKSAAKSRLGTPTPAGIGGTGTKKETPDGRESPSTNAKGSKTSGMRNPAGTGLLKPRSSLGSPRMSKIMTSTPKPSHVARSLPAPPPDVSVLSASRDSKTSVSSESGMKPGNQTKQSLCQRSRNGSVSSEISVTSATSTISRVSIASQLSSSLGTRKRKSLAVGGSAVASGGVSANGGSMAAGSGSGAASKRYSLATSSRLKTAAPTEPKKPGLSVSSGRPANKTKTSGLASPRKPLNQNKNRPATAGNTTSSASTPTRGGANSASNATAPTSSKSGNSSTTSGATKRSVAEQHAVEISRLEALCESRTKELNYVKMQLNQSAAGFEAMSVIFNYTANGLDALSCPAVKRQLEVTRLRLENTHLQLVELMTQRDALIEEIKGLKERQRHELERLQQEHGEALTTQEKRLQDDHQLHQDKLKEEHSEHIASLKTSHERNLEEIAHKHESALEKVHKDHEAFLLLEKQRSKADIADLQQQHELALTDITKRFDNIKMTLSEKVEQLRSESEAMRRRERECLAAYKADAEAQVSRAVTPYKHLPQEIDSLKAVLEMRNTEIRDLRVRNQQLEKQLEELPKAMEKISQLEQKNENLEAVIKIKADNERQLSEKHSVLLRRYDKEAKANKRLSMDKDQLEWRLSHDSAALEVMLNRSISHSPPSSNNSTPEPTRRKKSPLPQQSPRSPRGGIAMEFFEPKSPRASPRTNGTNSLHRKQIRSADFDRPIPTLSNRHSSADLYASRPDRHSHDLDENDVMSTSQDDSVIMSVSTQSEPVAPRSPMSPSGGKTNLKRSGTYDLLNEDNFELCDEAVSAAAAGNMKQTDV